MPEALFKVELGKSMADQEVPGHNRWHPDIPAAAATDPGTAFRIGCLDWTNGQVGNNDSANDIRDMDLDQNHVLSGPIQINGAEPGDVLVVDILNMGPFPNPDTEWGYTGIFSRQNGGGFLTDHYPDAHKAIWDLRGVHATSRHIPDVRFVGIQHPGLIGCAPSAELLAEWNRREQALIDTNPHRVPPLALPPARGEPPRAGSHRHEPRPGAPARPASARQQCYPGDLKRLGFRSGGQRGSPNGSSARARRQRRHQEPHDRIPRLL